MYIAVGCFYHGPHLLHFALVSRPSMILRSPPDGLELVGLHNRTTLRGPTTAAVIAVFALIISFALQLIAHWNDGEPLNIYYPILHSRFVSAGQSATGDYRQSGLNIPLAAESPYAPIASTDIHWIQVI